MRITHAMLSFFEFLYVCNRYYYALIACARTYTYIYKMLP